MKILIYFDRVMHYHIRTLQELERRIHQEGGELILVSGRINVRETGRVGISEPIVQRQIVIPFIELMCGTYTIRYQPQLPGIVKRLAPDVVIVMGHVGSITYWQLGILAKRLHFKYVTWQCGYEYNSGLLKQLSTTRFFRLFDHHLAYNTHAKKYLEKNGIDGSRITVIHNTINEEEIPILPRNLAKTMVATELNVPVERPMILYVGAILEEKRVDRLLAATRCLPANSVSLVIVGDGPALRALKLSSSDLDYVRYPGRVINGVGRFFDAADVFVLPGTGGLAINEAMAHGLPIITAFADGSAYDLVMDSTNGFILKTDGSEEIAARIESVLRDPEKRLKMGNISRQLITTKFSFKSFIDRIMHGLLATYSDVPTSAYSALASSTCKSRSGAAAQQAHGGMASSWEK